MARELFLKKGRQISNITQCGVDTERADGILQRSWVAGVTPAEIIIAQIATQLLILVCQTAIGLIFAILVFGIEVRGSIGVVILLTLLQGFGGMSFGKQNLSNLPPLGLHRDLCLRSFPSKMPLQMEITKK